MASGTETGPRQRPDRVSEALRRAQRFLSGQDLHEEMARAGAGVGLATVYRRLRRMEAAGEVETIHRGSVTLFRAKCSDEHHHHLVCEQCGVTVQFSSPHENWLSGLADEHDFDVARHTLEVFGRCRDCA